MFVWKVEIAVCFQTDWIKRAFFCNFENQWITFNESISKITIFLLSHSLLASTWWNKYFIAFNIFSCIVLLVTEILSKCALGVFDCSNHVVPYQPEGLINIVNLFISLDADKLYSPFGNLFSAKFWKDLDIKSLTFNMTR